MSLHIPLFHDSVNIINNNRNVDGYLINLTNDTIKEIAHIVEHRCENNIFYMDTHEYVMKRAFYNAEKFGFSEYQTETFIAEHHRLLRNLAICFGKGFKYVN